MNRDPSGHIALTPGGQRRRERVGVVTCGLVEDLDDGAVLGGEAQQLTSSVHVVCTEDHIDLWGPHAHGLAVFLGQTTTDGDLQLWPAGFFGLQMPE